MTAVLLHELPDFGDLIEVLAGQMGIDPGLVEKDYWIMHALWVCRSAASSSNSRAEPLCLKVIS